MLYTKKELVGMCNKALRSQLDLSITDQFEPDDALFFWMMYGIGASTMLGFLSKEGGKKRQIEANRIYDRIGRDFKSRCAVHQSIVEAWGNFSISITEVSRAIQDHDGTRTVEALIAALDAVTKYNVLLALFKEATVNENFKKDCQEAIFSHEKELTDRFGEDIRSEDYFHMLEAFFAANVENKMGEWYKDFGKEALTELEKAEDQQAAADSVRVMYGARR